jgi:hypothetical protein
MGLTKAPCIVLKTRVLGAFCVVDVDARELFYG